MENIKTSRRVHEKHLFLSNLRSEAVYVIVVKSKLLPPVPGAEMELLKIVSSCISFIYKGNYGSKICKYLT